MARHAGTSCMRTHADPTGTRVLGTFANCSAGKTPWGTYLTSEENIDDYFAGARTVRETSKDAALLDAHAPLPAAREQLLWLGSARMRASTCAWSRMSRCASDGWWRSIRTIPPPCRASAPSLGRFQHEGANTIVGKSGHVAAYMGDDEKFEYIYKFVTRDRFDAKNPAANRDLLDHGTLYCARFDADGTGEWLPLVHDENGPLNSRAGFASQGDVVIKARAAADLLGATPMDRPEDVEPSPITGRIYIPCTKSEDRGVTRDGDLWNGRKAEVGVNAANPRPENKSGHIIEIAEAGDDATATRFEWNVFLLAGDPAAGRYIVDAREIVPGSLASTDTYFGGYPNRADVSPAPLPRQSRHRSAGPPLDRHRTPTIRGVPTMAASWCPPADRSAGCSSSSPADPRAVKCAAANSRPMAARCSCPSSIPGEGGTLDNPRSHWPDGNGMPARAALLAIEREDGGPGLTLLAEREARSGGIQFGCLRVGAMNYRSSHRGFLRHLRCSGRSAAAPAFPRASA